ncbi:40S ribosomal protein S4-like [Penaeus japonicus]|uniref:40S ribosomal protein S4-like n=1 Tax=Penaeus japonicus TaxID=27405 RepID=UPI001C70CF98|nr:40S ribosomal protein S4-like [Penaeus japonicus]
MVRGPKHHCKRVCAPKSWLLDKLGGVFAPRPSTGPHKRRECLPLVILLRNRLKYALTNDEVKKITMQRLIRVDGKIRIDKNYPTGFMGAYYLIFQVLVWIHSELLASYILDIREKKGLLELFQTFTSIVVEYRNGRIFTNYILRNSMNKRKCPRIYDSAAKNIISKAVHSGKSPSLPQYKLCKVTKVCVGPKKVPYLTTSDGRTLRYPDPIIKVNDSILFDLEKKKMKDLIKFDTGNLCMITSGCNMGRVGTIVSRERHAGSFDIVHVKDTVGHTFATRLNNVFVIGKGTKAYISLPRGKGVKLSIAEERDRRLAQKIN